MLWGGSLGLSGGFKLLLSFKLFYTVHLLDIFLSSMLGVEKSHDDIIDGTIQAVREHLGPVVAFKSAVIVPALPKVSW